MIPSSITELERIKAECKSMVNKRATASAAAAVVPLPGIDVGADIAIMLELLPTINRKFGLSPEQIDQLDSDIKGQIAVIITSIGSNLVGKVITKETIMLLLKKVGARVTAKQIAKFVPFVGQAVSAGVSFSAMKYLGHSHIDECYEVCRQIILNSKNDTIPIVNGSNHSRSDNNSINTEETFFDKVKKSFQGN